MHFLSCDGAFFEAKWLVDRQNADGMATYSKCLKQTNGRPYLYALDFSGERTNDAKFCRIAFSWGLECAWAIGV